jgi:dihydrofolate synthase/folylpolyglutamate synthase
MLRTLGDPHLELEYVHIGGTNGKGSTAMLAEAALRRSGRITGLYASPHLSEFSERICIRGVPADANLLEDCAKQVLGVAEREDASFFESATVLAFEAFRRAGCETVVAEVGLGGRLDATNVVQPQVAVIASVDMDHSDFLGDTLERIAFEKAGILKAGVPAVLGPLARGPTEVVAARAMELGAPLDIFGRDLAVDHVSVGVDGTRFRYLSGGWANGLQVRTRLVGHHQARNAALAIRSLERYEFGVSREDVASGMSDAVLPGRFEVLTRRGRSWVLDIAHNPAAVRVLADLVRSLPIPRPVVFLVAILGDKPWGEMLDPLLAAGSAVVLTTSPSSPVERRWKLDEVLTVTSGRAADEPDFGRAMTRARELAGEGTVIVTGSAHTVGDARSLFLTDTDEY